MIHCECGCGELIHSITTEGQPARFKTHHNIISGDKTPHWKGGRVRNSGGYVLIYCADHPYRDTDNYVREHRLIMEEYLGRYLRPEEVVHHINGIKTDNRIQNLELIESHSEHIKQHHDRERNRLGRFL